jgi:IS5 family transposase
MLTCKSPRKVMLVAHHLGLLTLPKYRSKFSRHDFTLPQLFACLVLKEQQRKTYREVEALLRDAPHWCRQIGMKKVPDHNTLCRAFHSLNLSRRTGGLLARLTQWFAVAKQLGTVVALDSSLYDPRYRSRHYEQRCRHYASPQRNGSVNASRRRTARLSPKLSVGVCTRSHLILSARARTGFGSDCRDFEPLLFDAWKRHPRLRTVLADAGYDSESNHRLARLDLGVRSLIKAGIGRPSKKPPSGYYRRLMSKRLKGSQKGKTYGQRAQAETANSMLKRNLGDALRARSPRARREEQLLRVLVHNIALLCDEIEG